MSGLREPFGQVTSAAVLLPRDNVDTDQVIPARFLKTIDRAGLADQLFADWRYDAEGRPRPEFVLNRPESAGRQVLVAGDNFGCGSSREHAPWALVGWGFRAVISSSFADIFRANALKNGLLPIEVAPEELRRITALIEAHPDLELAIDLQAQSLTLPDGSQIGFAVDPFARRMLLEGTDELGYLLAHGDAVDAYEASHPARVSTLARA
ncbi:MAG: 3-isopropylmalate dehydratase small subunit [Candidatus Limnocylindria bacterium]